MAEHDKIPTTKFLPLKIVMLLSTTLLSTTLQEPASKDDFSWTIFNLFKIRAVAGQRSSPESGFANKTKIFFRAKNKRQKSLYH